MTQQREPDNADTTYRYLHLSLEELAQLPPDELLQACLEMRRLLDIIMSVLYTADSTLMMRAGPPGGQRPSSPRGCAIRAG